MHKHVIYTLLFLIFCIASYFLSSIILSQIKQRHEHSLLLSRSEKTVQEKKQRELSIKTIMQDNRVPEDVQKTLLRAPSTQTFTMILALYLAYRNHIEEVYWDDEIQDFVLVLNGKRVALANGRLIFVERVLEDLLNYTPVMYPYRLSPLAEIYDSIPAVDETIHERLRSTDIQEALTMIEDVSDLIHVYFLGVKIRIHPLIKESLLLVNEEINALAARDKEIKKFLDSLQTISSYSNRKIKKSRNASLHSFGMAIDFLHPNYDYKSVYWQWTRVARPKVWRKLPFDDLWLIPQEIVSLFEGHGFLWGGKWSSYDTLHFEYRPEMIEYAKVRKRLLE